MKILVLNGPNLNLLGVREPDVYGNQSYESLCYLINDYCNQHGIKVEIYQTNIEGELVNKIHYAYFEKFDGIVINPAAYTHTSIAILDAIKAVNIPTVEVHISNVNEREDFRKISYIKSACIKSISGLGFDGYIKAIEEISKFKGK